MADGFGTAFAAVINAIFLIASVYVYLSLSRQIGLREPAVPDAKTHTFGPPDVIVALLLASLFAVNAFLSTHADKLAMHASDLIFNGMISGGLFVLVAGFLKLRGLNVDSLAGFSRISFSRVIATGIVLLLAAYPLILLADALSQRVLGVPASRQGIVELFSGSQTLAQRVIIIILAVVIAPMVEEFVFRFYLYGVVRRYVGRFAGLLFNSLLFAAVHAHLPSAAPLFVLGSCFTIAYEWSGSILVTMTMHALFNSLTLTALAFPNLIPQ